MRPFVTRTGNYVLFAKPRSNVWAVFNRSVKDVGVAEKVVWKGPSVEPAIPIAKIVSGVSGSAETRSLKKLSCDSLLRS